MVGERGRRAQRSWGCVSAVTGGLLDPTAVGELASQLGLRPTKQRGQNFVTDANTVRRIVAAAQVAEDDIVLEVGPGLGSLTLGLLQAATRVIAIEIDDLLAAQLPQTVAARLPDRVNALTVINADALRVDAVPEPPTAVVANLPYNVAVRIENLRRTLGQGRLVRRGQQGWHRIADRLLAGSERRVWPGGHQSTAAARDDGDP